MLVVEDDPILLEMLEQALSREFTVYTARDGHEAISLLRTQPVRAVISDQMMPGMVGTEVLRNAIELQPGAGRIVVTASENVDDVRDAVNVARADRFVAKPLRPLELVSLVKSVVRERELQEENERLLIELREKNAALTDALSDVRAHERRLEDEVVRRTRELRTVVTQLEQMALRDGLTGLFNHRYFQEALASELGRCVRHERKAALIFIDVDHFKNYNDTHGHLFGDELLKQIAKILSNTGEHPEVTVRGRVSDIACRYGGEEFVLILPESDKKGAAIRAERIRGEVERFEFAGRDKQPGGKVTISVGVAAFPEDGRTKPEIIQAADDAMFRAKRAGRNRVRLAGTAD